MCLPGTGDLTPLSLINSEVSPVLLRAAWNFPVRVKGHLKADTQTTTFSSTVYSMVPFLPKISGLHTGPHIKSGDANQEKALWTAGDAGCLRGGPSSPWGWVGLSYMTPWGKDGQRESGNLSTESSASLKGHPSLAGGPVKRS